jgi:hypothetical protein
MAPGVKDRAFAHRLKLGRVSNPGSGSASGPIRFARGTASCRISSRFTSSSLARRAYSATAFAVRPYAIAEHSAITADARAIGLVK